MFKRKRVKAAAVERLDELRGLTAEGKPVLIDFWQTGCQPCRTMDGIVDELAAEFEGTAHVVKVDVRRAPELAMRFKVQSTPTFVLLARSQKQPSKKARKRAAQSGAPGTKAYSPRWRASGLVQKDVLMSALTSNGATPASA
jgi:thiol-disulfide isomerase/thioredoxin